MNIVNIPRIIIKGPKDRVATWVIFSPRTPTKVAEKIVYRIIGRTDPIIMAFFKRCSWPLISFRSSGIEVKPSRAKRMTPMGKVKFSALNVVRLFSWINGMNFIKIPKIIIITVMTPYVSIRFSSLRPRLRRSVMTIQKNIAKTTGGVLPGMSFDKDCPSPIR